MYFTKSEAKILLSAVLDRLEVVEEDTREYFSLQMQATRFQRKAYPELFEEPDVKKMAQSSQSE